jgi:hypothetical protein
MIIVPNLRWHVFRYQVVRATYVQGIGPLGWSPAGAKLGNSFTDKIYHIPISSSMTASMSVFPMGNETRHGPKYL